MNFTELKKVLAPDYKKMTKADFIAWCQGVDGRVKVGTASGKGRLTAKRALILLGVKAA
jgi:hypothetical protein